jgi:hypothetical protein
MILLGLFIVALAIPFRVDGVSVSDGRPILNLPKWAYPWGNDYDGLLGDKRLWWAANAPWGIDYKSFLGMYLWTAIRNPANNMRMFPLWSAPITGSMITYKGDYTVEDKPGMDGWQFVTVENKGKKWYGLYFVRPWNNTHAFVVRVGFKVKPSHQWTVDSPKGMVFKVSFWKEL